MNKYRNLYRSLTILSIICLLSFRAIAMEAQTVGGSFNNEFQLEFDGTNQLLFVPDSFFDIEVVPGFDESLGELDTIVVRLENQELIVEGEVDTPPVPPVPAPTPIPFDGTIDIELVGLSLLSIAPIELNGTCTPTISGGCTMSLFQFGLPDIGGGIDKLDYPGTSWDLIFEIDFGEIDLSPLIDIGGSPLLPVFGSWSGDWYVDYAYTPSIQPVPIPAAIWLFGSVLAGLAGFKVRRDSRVH